MAVTKIDLQPDGSKVENATETVPPNEKRDFYVHSHRELHVKEMPTS